MSSKKVIVRPVSRSTVVVSRALKDVSFGLRCVVSYVL